MKLDISIFLQNIFLPSTIFVFGKNHPRIGVTSIADH